MFNPLAQIKLLSEELGKVDTTGDSNKLGIIEALLLKFLFAFVLVFCIFVYLDKTSSLNNRPPELNAKIQKGELTEEEADKIVAEMNKKQTVKSKEGDDDDDDDTNNLTPSVTRATGRSRKV